MFDSILCQLSEYDPEVQESLIGSRSKLLVRVEKEGALARCLNSEMSVLSRSLILDPLFVASGVFAARYPCWRTPDGDLDLPPAMRTPTIRTDERC